MLHDPESASALGRVHVANRSPTRRASVLRRLAAGGKSTASQRVIQLSGHRFTVQCDVRLAVRRVGDLPFVIQRERRAAVDLAVEALG